MAEHDASYLIIGSEQYNFRDDSKLPTASPSATGDFTVEGDIYFNEGADPLSTQLSNKADSADLADVATSGEAVDVTYDNANSGLVAEDVQAAIDEVVTDLSDKMDKVDPVGTGSLSMNRKENTTVGLNSATEGTNNTASDDNAHAEGYYTIASGSEAHAEGAFTTASGGSSHAEGAQSVASGTWSHTEGLYTEAAGEAQHVSGKYNEIDTSDTYAEIIGNGTSENNRKNARTLDWSGNETIAGDLYFNGGVNPLSTQLSAKADASDLPGGYVGDITAAGQSVAHGTSWTTLLHVDITPGIYIVSWAASFASSGGTNTGYRGAGVATTGDPFAYMSAQVPAVTNNTYTLVSGSAIHKTTSNQTLNLKVRQYSTAGSNLTVTPRLQIIKIA